MLERIGGQVELAPPSVLECAEVGQVAGDVGVGHGFGDLAMVGAFAAQRRDRLRRGRGSGQARRAAAVSTGCGPTSSSTSQPSSASVRHTLGEFDRLPRMAAPVVAVESHVPAQRRAGAVAHQNPLRRAELEPARVRLEFVEDRIEQSRVEGVAGVQPVAADIVGR